MTRTNKVATLFALGKSRLGSWETKKRKEVVSKTRERQTSTHTHTHTFVSAMISKRMML